MNYNDKNNILKIILNDEKKDGKNIAKVLLLTDGLQETTKQLNIRKIVLTKK